MCPANLSEGVGSHLEFWWYVKSSKGFDQLQSVNVRKQQLDPRTYCSVCNIVFIDCQQSRKASYSNVIKSFRNVPRFHPMQLNPNNISAWLDGRYLRPQAWTLVYTIAAAVFSLSFYKRYVGKTEFKSPDLAQQDGAWRSIGCFKFYQRPRPQ